jgi:hypothetical protein
MAKGTTLEHTETERSSGAAQRDGIHLSLQGKGGVGKSLVASILAQYFRSRSRSIQCIDTDPVNRTFAQYSGIDTTRLELMWDGSIDVRGFDGLMERLLTEDGTFVIDTGGSGHPIKATSRTRYTHGSARIKKEHPFSCSSTSTVSGRLPLSRQVEVLHLRRGGGSRRRMRSVASSDTRKWAGDGGVLVNVNSALAYRSKSAQLFAKRNTSIELRVYCERCNSDLIKSIRCLIKCI